MDFKNPESKNGVSKTETVAPEGINRRNFVKTVGLGSVVASSAGRTGAEPPSPAQPRLADIPSPPNSPRRFRFCVRRWEVEISGVGVLRNQLLLPTTESSR